MLLGYVVDLALVITARFERLERDGLLFAHHASVDNLQYVFPMRICENGKLEFLHVAAIELIAGPGEVLGATIGVQSVREAFTNGEHVAAGPIGRLENHHIVASLAELPGATQAGQARTSDNHPLGPRRRGHRPRTGDVCQECCQFENVTPMQHAYARTLRASVIDPSAFVFCRHAQFTG